MKKEEFEKDMLLLKTKVPNVYNDIACVMSPFYRLFNELDIAKTELLQEKYNLSVSELEIITSLFYSGGETHTLTPTKLTQRIQFSSGGMTKILKKLESKKLVYRVENRKDARSRLVKLSKEGIRLAQEGLKDVLAFEEDYFSILTTQEKKQLSKLLLKSLKV